MSHDLYARARATSETVAARTGVQPRVGIVLGTGLGALTDVIDVDATIEYSELEGFSEPTVETHSGRLVLGTLDGTPVVAMQGRFHRYEGYSLQEVTFPIRVLKLLGAESLIVSNVSGGMNPLWSVGELVLLDDHINMLGDSPLIGPNDDRFGPRFPDMSEPYDRELQTLAMDAALELGIRLNRGVYVAVPGPQLETRAEYRMLRHMGADVVGMSTVPEVIVARHMDMRVLGVSIITDACLPDALEPVDVSRIIAAAGAAEPHLTRLIERVIGQI
ncbi:MAG: purine-nucleoside phosphorylase [Gemmatimonadota bacterium]|nr:purine-nucleoside phosphorylase [Gemmatimonadota bacterium]MDE3004659.1 purine-nucleoside phosphorylase [Gemmatimonadota bacterium]MDE3014528.1 purine-nucleoside phosphorylase [Gemmatimonadota bacterium]